MMDGIKQMRRSNDAVTEIIGTMLLIAISLGLFSVVYVSVLSVPYTPPVPTANVAMQVNNDELILEHYGGDTLDLDTKILLKFGNENPTEILLGDYIVDDKNNDNKFGIGERIVYSNSKLNNTQTEINIIDPTINAIVVSGKTGLAPVEYTLYTSSSGTGSGTIETNVSGPYSSGQKVMVWANASIGSHFVKWSGHLSGSATPKSITMNADKSITAQFNLNSTTYALSITTSGDGSGTVETNKTGPYEFGSVVRVWANASVGSDFISWSGDLSGSTTPQDITMNDDKSIDAQFNIESSTYTLTINTYGDGSGTVETNKTGPYDPGDIVRVWANASAGSDFTTWTGDLSGSTTPQDITMNEDKTINAWFNISEMICETFFNEDHEDGDDWGETSGPSWQQGSDNWCEVDDYSRDGSSYEGTLIKSTSVEIIIDTTDYEFINIEFYSKINGYDSGENGRFQISYNGLAGPWNTVDTYTDHDWTQRTYNLSSISSGACDDNDQFAIRFITNAGSGNEALYLDDITLDGCTDG